MATLRERLERGIVCGEDARELFRAIELALGGSATILGHDAPEFTRYAGTVTDAWLAAYVKVRAQDPSTAYLARRPLGTIFQVAVRTPRRSYMALHRAFRVAGFGDALIIRLPAPGRLRGILVVYRAAERGPFGAAELEDLQLIYPSMALALNSVRAVAALHAPASEGRATVLSHARVVHLDASGTMTASDETWRHLADRHHLTSPRLRRRLGRALLGAIAWKERSGPRLERVLPTMMAEAFPLGNDRWLVFLDETIDWLGARGVEHRLGILSNRQREVAALVATGSSLRQVAARLHIAEETAKTHLRAVYHRLGINNRALLGRFLVRETPDPPSPGPGVDRGPRTST